MRRRLPNAYESNLGRNLPHIKKFAWSMSFLGLATWMVIRWEKRRHGELPPGRAKAPKWTVQTLLFRKARWSPKTAQAWAARKYYRTMPIEGPADYWRIRQRSPKDFKPDSLKTVSYGKGIKVVMGFLL